MIVLLVASTQYNIICRVWLYLKQPTDDPNSNFNWSRDNVYVAIILLGLGGAILMVISLSMIALLIGKHSVCIR